MEQKIEDKDLGIITLRVSAKAKHYTLKISNGEIVAVMPRSGSEGKMLAFIEEKRQQLIKALLNRPARKELNESTELQTATFKLEILCARRNDFHMTLKDKILRITCPLDTDFSRAAVQKVLTNLLGRALTHEATRVLPERLRHLAEHHGFLYSGIRITKTKSCWGSCNGDRFISLSRSIMLLPGHLIDYILLHELCHTLEMSHNDRFWMLMNHVTDNKAKVLRKEMKHYHTI